MQTPKKIAMSGKKNSWLDEVSESDHLYKFWYYL